jgi:hypothetical protein
METDKKKAAGRAAHWVEYQWLLARRKQLEQILAELKAERFDTSDEAQVARLTTMINATHERIQAIVEPQRKARVGSFAPRYKIEGRIKGGWLAPRKRQLRRQGPSAEEARGIRQQRLDALQEDDQVRVSELHSLFGKLKQRALDEEESARAMIGQVVQILQPLTGRDSRAVLRSNLPSLRRIRDGSVPLHVDLTAATWGGRQDIDLVALFQHHRAQFEQVYRLLSDWSTYDQSRRKERRGLRRASRLPVWHSHDNSDDSDSGDGDADPDLGTPFAAVLAPIVRRFNESEQNEDDLIRAITALRAWLEDRRASAAQAPWPPLSEAQRERLQALLEMLSREYERMV